MLEPYFAKLKLAVIESESQGRSQLLIIAGLLWLGALLNTALPSEPGFFALRGLLSILAVLCMVSFVRSEKSLLLISPLFVLSILALVGYSLIEALYALNPALFSVGKIPDARPLSYTGSLGEALALQFCAYGFFMTALIYRLRLLQAPESADIYHYNTWSIVQPVATAAIIVFLAFDVWVAMSPDFRQLVTVGLGKQLADCVEPLTAFSFIALAHCASRRGGSTTLCLCAVALSYLAIKSWIGLAQMPFMIVFVASAYYLLKRRITLLASGLMLCAVVSIVFVAAYGIAQTRFKPYLSPNASAFEAVKFVFSLKIILRQGQSAYCLNRIVSNHRPGPDAERPLYFISAVVPRVIWPNKPNLSRGYEFGTKYCGDHSRPDKPHYELVTILAEPVLFGGFTGLAVMQVFLGTGLMLITFAMLRGGSVTLITLIALLPWLIHFQQSFALYFANAVKMFIYMLPAIVLLWWWSRRQQPDEPDLSP